MIYITLFLSFLKIGVFTFGGGYAMIAIIRETVLAQSWLSEEELLNFIAISESTPGPIAVNMATFVGASQGGLLGSILATLGVVLPSFVIILLIASLISKLLQYEAVAAFLGGIRPCVVAMILTTAITVALSTLFSFKAIGDPLVPDIRGILILAALLFVSFASKKLLHKKPSPILLILLSAALGVLLYAL